MNRPDEPEVNLNQILERLSSFFRRFGAGGRGGSGLALLVLVILGGALVIWLGTGFYTVEPGEQAAQRRLGRFITTEGPGLHWWVPRPLGMVDKVNTEQVRRLEIGLRGATPVIEESSMITGDENLVDVQLIIQYDIQRSMTDPETGRVMSAVEQYLFRSRDPDGIILKSATESALREVVGQRDIDDVLTEEKEEVQAETKELLQGLLDSYQTGIRLREVKLQNVQPPEQVKDAFDDVVRAKEDKERIINLAQAYQEDILPRARGDASRTIQAAQAFSAERIANATGEASRFLQVLNEFRESEDVTRQRLYLEAMEEILPGVTKFVVATDTGGNLLQFLPLTNSSATPFGPGRPSSP